MPLTPDEQVAAANKLMRQIESQLPPDQGVVLLLFPFHRPGLTTYISNAQREGMVTVLRGLLGKWESEGSL